MLLCSPATFAARRGAVASGDLARLAASLERDLQPLLEHEPHVPETKALLSRAGGRCERDGAPLDFDPWSPHEHHCPRCRMIHRGELHHRAWITYYHLWLIERAVHGALLFALRDDDRAADGARRILAEYAHIYLRLPNRDNVLGPTRLFFSTYLESIWLLNATLALDLLGGGAGALRQQVIDRVIEPSASLVAEYDEGMSNRQVWNNAALMAASAVMGDDDAFEARAAGARRSDLVSHLRHGLLSDSTWYEGENYHLFALRGLWYSVIMCETRGVAIPRELSARFDHAFVTPYLTALPDFTMLSRKDSQYAVSLRQWRLAELAELGFARTSHPVLGAALAHCYDDASPAGEVGRARSTSDVEQNRPAARLTRADLGWRALLHALPVLPPLRAEDVRSALLEAQGIAVFRRAPRRYVALDYGESGGGHGHPDRLNLVVADERRRWLDDLGTGSYVDPSLHWYRSTLAHNAPLVNGRSQPLRDGQLVAYDERDGVGWVAAGFTMPEHGARLERAVVVTPDYLVDELRCTLEHGGRVELPWHLDIEPPSILAPASLDGGEGIEDGFRFARDARAASLDAAQQLDLAAVGGASCTLWASQSATLFHARAPGQPAAELRPFYIMRCEMPPSGGTVVMRAVFAWQPGWTSRVSAESVVVEGAGERHVHRRVADRASWRIEFEAGGARSSIDLGGARERQAAPPVQEPQEVAPIVVTRTATLGDWLNDAVDTAVMFDLDHAHYRRTDESWEHAGSPAARVAFAADQSRLRIYARVRAHDARFAAGDADNPYDNEHPDTMGSGIQLYVRTPDVSGAWMLVPESETSRVRVRSIEGWGEQPHPAARWRASDDGYEVVIDVALPAEANVNEYPMDLDVIVNEAPRDRVRRRGQLVLSGAVGEFAYLRGDRHDASRLIPLVIVT